MKKYLFHKKYKGGNPYLLSLTIGKWYDVLDESRQLNIIYIMNDNNQPIWVDKKYFKSVREVREINLNNLLNNNKY